MVKKILRCIICENDIITYDDEDDTPIEDFLYNHPSFSPLFAITGEDEIVAVCERCVRYGYHVLKKHDRRKQEIKKFNKWMKKMMKKKNGE